MSRISKMTRAAVSCMAVALVSGAWAETWTDSAGYTWTYDIYSGAAKIYKHGDVAISPEPAGAVAIPSTLGGTPVTSIGRNAFRNCRGLTGVTIPDSVTSIGGAAFAGCSGLTSVTIPDGVTSIEDDAFAGCSGLTSMTIPDSVTRIGGGAFESCSGLTSMTIPQAGVDSFSSAFLNCDRLTHVTLRNSVTSIGASAFSGCSGLTSVTIPDTVTSIGKYAFSGCSGLESVMIPNSVSSIGVSAFSGCDRLKSTTIPQTGVNSFKSAFSGYSALSLTIAEGAWRIGASAFSDCSGLMSVTIPDSVTSIGKYAFRGCSGLTNVVLVSGVTNIGAYAFGDCSGLASVTIPDSVTSIGTDVFSGCSGLTNVVIGSGVTHIGEFAFFGCSGLTSVTIPDSVTSIGKSVFDCCSSLTNLQFNGNAPSMESDGFADVAPGCCAHVYRASTGWGVEIPGTWKGIGIDYIARSIVSFDANGGIGGASVELDWGAAIVPPIVMRTGYTFVGWSPTVDAAVPVSNATYTAQWRPNQYTVTFDANGGTGGMSMELDYGATIVAPMVSRERYTFIGWSPEVDATVPMSNVTYTARWRHKMKIVCAYPFRRNVDYTPESGYFGCAIPANMITGADAQPLLGEWFGMQVHVDASGMADVDPETIEVHMTWFAGESPWGWENWKGNANVKDVVLERAADWSADNLFYRSNPTVQESFVPPQVAGNGYQVVQYQIWMKFKDKNGDLQGIRYLDASDWMRPVWYDPLDLNKTYGSFSAYTILDHIPPRRVWINEVNMYQCGNLSDTEHQYIEIAAPLGYDLTGWSVSAVQPGDGYDLSSLFTMGVGGVKSMKVVPPNGNYVFYAIQSHRTRAAGTYGPLDGTWNANAFGRYNYDGTEDITRPCALRLQRPSGIIEHEIVFMCTNTLPRMWAWYYDGTNFLKEVKENIVSGGATQWFYAGADDQGRSSVDDSLGVYTGHGEENTWTNEMVQTPGEANRLADGSQQNIDPNYFKPATDPILFVYADIEWNSRDFLAMVVDGMTNTSAVVVAPQNFDGTSTASIVFFVKDGYEIDTVTTNDGIVAEASGKTGTWNLDIRSFDPNLRTITVLASARPVGGYGDTEPIPAIASDAEPEAVSVALEGTVDTELTANVTNVAQYAAYRIWALSVTNGTTTAQMIKESTRTWLSFALGADALIGKEITSNDVRIVAFEATNVDGGAMGSSRPTSFVFEVVIDGVNIGGGMVAVEILKENLKKVLDVEGTTTLSPDAFSSDNIDITFDTPVDGKARFTVSPPADAGNSFFMRVKVK